MERVWTEYRGWDGGAIAWEQYDLRTDPLQLESLHANQLRPCAYGSCQFYEAL